MNFKAENRLTTSTGQRKGSRVRKDFNVFANHHPKVDGKEHNYLVHKLRDVFYLAIQSQVYIPMKLNFLIFETS